MLEKLVLECPVLEIEIGDDEREGAVLCHHDLFAEAWYSRGRYFFEAVAGLGFLNLF